jgi:hypothetical protein
MTPLEKARELVDKYYWIFGDGYLGQQHIQCALIAVDEIIKLRKGYFDCTNPMQDEKYWQQVKQEIENL